MIVDPEHDQVAELLGVYVLDAVQPEERTLVERHLTTCQQCRADVDDLRQVSADLAVLSALDNERPPAAVWERIAAGIAGGSSGESAAGIDGESAAGIDGESAAGIDGESAAGIDGGSAAGIDGESAAGIAGGSAAGIEPGLVTDQAAAAATPEVGAVEDLAEARRQRTSRPGADRRRAWVTAAVSGAAAAAIVALAVGLVRTQDQVHQLQTALAGQGSAAAVQSALASPGHEVVDLRSGAGVRLAQVVLRHDGAGFVVRSAMPPLPARQTYQLWASINGRPISLGLLGRRPAPGVAFSLGTSANGARELMVTVEPAGGVPTPDRRPIATAPLPVT